jgi:N4-gp56 family major capsid protein
MAIGPTTSSVVDPVVNEWYSGLGLARALPYLNHAKWGQLPVRPFEMKKGTRVMFRRYESMPVQKAPLVEMTTPSPIQVSKTDVYGDLVQYGAYMKYSDKVAYTTEDPALSEFSALMGENGGESIDEAQRDQLLATTSVFRAGAVSLETSVVTKALAADFDKIYRVLLNARAKPVRPNGVKASTGVGTGPVRPSYYVLIHPDMVYDVDNTTNFPGFKHPTEYPDGGASADPSEIGAYKNFRFLVSDKEYVNLGGGAAVASTGLASTGGLIDVYHCLVFAKDAYGIVPLNGHAYETIVTELKADKADPLGQYGTIGWKAMQTLVLLNETFMLRYECGATE